MICFNLNRYAYARLPINRPPQSFHKGEMGSSFEGAYLLWCGTCLVTENRTIQFRNMSAM